MSRRPGGDGRYAPIVLVATLGVFVALVLSTSLAYGAPDAKQPPAKAAKKEPKVEASIRRGQLEVRGTARSERIALRLKPGNKSRLQVDVGANGFAEFTFNRSAFNRIVVHGAGGAADVVLEDEPADPFAVGALPDEVVPRERDSGGDEERGDRAHRPGGAEEIDGGEGAGDRPEDLSPSPSGRGLG